MVNGGVTDWQEAAVRVRLPLVPELAEATSDGNQHRREFGPTLTHWRAQRRSTRSRHCPRSSSHSSWRITKPPGHKHQEKGLSSRDSRNKTRPAKDVVVANSKQKVFTWTQLVVKYTTKIFGYDYTLYCFQGNLRTPGLVAVCLGLLLPYFVRK